MMATVAVRYRGRKKKIAAKRTGFFRKGFGLMFRSVNTKNLVFVFDKGSCQPFTSLFVFFPFVLLWLDKDDKVIGKEIVMPFKTVINPPGRYYRVVEIPMNRKNRKIVEFFVGKQKV